MTVEESVFHFRCGLAFLLLLLGGLPMFGCQTPDGFDQTPTADAQRVFGDQPDTISEGDETIIEAAGDADNTGVMDVPVSEEPVVVTGLEVTPTSLLVETLPGESVELDLTAELVYSDGNRSDVTDSTIWTTQNSSIVDIHSEMGIYGPPFVTGFSEGQVLVVGIQQGLSATCSVTVKLEDPPVVIFEDMSSVQVEAFQDLQESDSAIGPQWLYPSEGTVLPCGMYPPHIQWEAGEYQYFRLLMMGASPQPVAVYTSADSFLPDRDTWSILCDGSGDIELVLHGASGLVEGSEYDLSATRTVVGADAALGGLIYFWQIMPLGDSGDIMKLDSTSDSPMAENVFPESSTQGQSCRGCHTLSADGSKLAYAYQGDDFPLIGNPGTKGVITISQTDEPYPPMVPPQTDLGAETMTFDPSGTRMVLGNHNGIWLADLSEGFQYQGYLESTEDAASTYVTETPAWSPDGSVLVYSRRMLNDTDPSIPSGVGWGASIVRRYFVEGAFSAPSELLPAASIPDRPFADYPSWTPDSKWLGVRVAASKIGETNVLGQPILDGTMALVEPQTGDWTLMEEGAPPGYRYGRPSFSPFIEGGYYWLVFYSTAPYGHLKTGDGKQLWVMAVDTEVAPGEDPSHAAFWLPGQGLSAVNLSAFWARPVCVPVGGVCLDDEDCCVGSLCEIPDGATEGSCQPAGCTLPGEYCDAKTELCCEGYSCQQSLAGSFSCQPD